MHPQGSFNLPVCMLMLFIVCTVVISCLTSLQCQAYSCVYVHGPANVLWFIWTTMWSIRLLVLWASPTSITGSKRMFVISPFALCCLNLVSYETFDHLQNHCFLKKLVQYWKHHLNEFFSSAPPSKIKHHICLCILLPQYNADVVSIDFETSFLLRHLAMLSRDPLFR